jgi:hypothetical protein
MFLQLISGLRYNCYETGSESPFISYTLIHPAEPFACRLQTTHTGSSTNRAVRHALLSQINVQIPNRLTNKYSEKLI